MARGRLIALSASERAMKIQEIILKAMSGEIKWCQAAGIIGISEIRGLEKGICDSSLYSPCLHLTWQRSSLDSIAQRGARRHFQQGFHYGLQQSFFPSS
jgi:hypothetical protein